MNLPPTARLGLLGLTLALSACSALEGDKIDYKSASKGSTLEVPPDLQQLSRETRYATPGAVVSANALQAGQAVQPSGPSAAIDSLGGTLRLEPAAPRGAQLTVRLAVPAAASDTT